MTICRPLNSNSETDIAAQLIDRLKLAKSTVSYRVKSAISGGWLINLETRRGYPARLALTRRSKALGTNPGAFSFSRLAVTQLTQI
jgi:hypothetical protein